jgi:hypothetical protein
MEKKPENNMDKVVKKTNKVKAKKVKLIRYTVKATIPTGAYANICPEVVVEAETLEQAERAVMPHIEALFAKYREGGEIKVNYPPVSPTIVYGPATGPMTPKVYVGDDMSTTITSSTTAVAPAITMSEPFNRAKRAIEGCTTVEASQLIEDQVGKSVKLTGDEKQQLFTLVLLKRKEINGKDITS